MVLNSWVRTQKRVMKAFSVGHKPFLGNISININLLKQNKSLRVLEIPLLISAFLVYLMFI